MAAIPFKEKQKNMQIRDRVVDMYKQFVSEVDPKYVFDLLIEKRVISIEQKQEFMIKVTTKERCRALLDNLFSSSNDESFIILREALEDHYHWIVERIDQCEREKETTNNSDAKPYENKMTQTEKQEHSKDPANVNLPIELEEQQKKGFDAVKSNLEIENKHLETKLEESRKESQSLAQELQESRKAIAEMKEQYRILKENFDKAIDREKNLRKELDAIKNRAKSEIQDKGINEEVRDALKNKKLQQRSSASSSGTTNISIDERFTRNLKRLSSCCICSTTLQDNRMTPCFHIACLKCLEDIQSKSNKQMSCHVRFVGKRLQFHLKE